MKASAITRLVVALLTIINMVLMSMDMNPINIDEGVLTEVISGIAMIVATVVAWYKDSPLTKEAQVGTAVTRNLKDGTVSKEEADKFMEAKQKISE